MTKLLYIEASPRKTRSHSIAVAREFLDAYCEAHPTDEVETLDLWNYPLPEFNGFVIDAKYRILHGQSHSEEEATAWGEVVKVCQHFASADKYLFSLPMWNFGIPYKLKHYLDVLLQPGLTFTFSPETGYSGLITGRPAAVVYARGGEYDADATRGLDMQKSYLELALGFIGLKDLQTIKVDPTMAAPDYLAGRVEAAKAQARQIGATF